MSQILAVWTEPPPFPATDQHPDAVRYSVSGLIVDAIGGEPTEGEVDNVLNPPPLARPSLYAVGQIAVADGEISGFDINSKFAGGFVLDVGSYYILFAEIQPDTSYLAKAYDGGLVRAFVEQANKFEDGFIITVIDAAGDPVDVPNLSLEIIRVS
jgi:hypothetical protein